MERPNEAEIKTLEPGTKVKVNGRKYTIDSQWPTGNVTMTGARGGAANLVPSLCGGAVQVTTISSREWVRTIEVL